MRTADERLKDVGEAGAAMSLPAGTYASFSRCGNLIFSSGVVAREFGNIFQGTITEESIDVGEKAVRLSATSILLSLQNELGSLEHVEGVATLNGYLRVAEGFASHARVMDSASRLTDAIFLGQPLPARTTIGVTSLPGNGIVELSMVFRLK